MFSKLRRSNVLLHHLASTSDISKTNVQFQSISIEQVGLVEETELLRIELYDCLARVGSVLGRAKAALAKLEVVPDVSLLLSFRLGLCQMCPYYLRSKLVLPMGKHACMEISPLVLHPVGCRCLSCQLLLGVKLLSRSWLRCCRLCLSCRRFVGSLLRLFDGAS